MGLFHHFRWVVVVVVAWSNLVSAQGPLVLGLGLKGLGLRVWGQGLTITHWVNLGAPGVGTDPIKLASRPFSHCGTQQLSEIKSAANPTPQHIFLDIDNHHFGVNEK